MTKRLPITILLIVCSFIWCYPQTRSDDDHLREIIRKRGEAEVTVTLPGKTEMDILSKNVSISSVKDNIVHIFLSPLTVEWFISARKSYSIIESSDPKGIAGASSVKEAMEWESYPSLPQYDSIMRSFAVTFPALCRLDTIGASVRGRQILVLKISPDAGTDKDQPEVFYSSTMHGNETAGFVLMLRLADYLLNNYHTDSRIRNLLDNLEIWINPLANPDGTYNRGNEITTPVRHNANGYDLNRNFPDPVSQTGTMQKETRDMIRFMAERRFVLSANFHSGAEVVNYPWDRWEREHPDNNWFYDLSRRYADTVHTYSSPGYMIFLDNGITKGYDWYQVYGGRQDYVTWELQGREVTIEIDNTHLTPETDLATLWESNYRSMIGYIESALYGIHGHIRDSETGDPVPARITVNNHDFDNSYIFSDSITGRFTRLIEPGSWDITFSAEGYLDTVVTDIITFPDERYTLDVEMRSKINPADTIDHEKPLLYPNPGSGYIKAVLPEDLRGEVNIKIFSNTGMILSDYDTGTSGRMPLIIDVNKLSAGSYIIVFRNKGNGVAYRSRLIISGRF